MKKTILFYLLFIWFFSYSQPPVGYYNTATGTGYTLKTQLHNIIKNSHNAQDYGSLWTLFTTNPFRDNYYENNGSLLDIYSEKPFGVDSYEYTSTSQQCGSYSVEGSCYNREHLVPQSFFDNFLVEPMKSDPFHVFPSDGYVNGQRGNFPFGVVSNASYTSTNTSKKGNNNNTGYSSGFTGTVFEPINEFKGDIARAFFYFVTRYEDNMQNFYNSNNVTSCPAKIMFDGSINKSFSQTFLNILYQWHIQDPVSNKEIDQNNAIFNYQGNRNPYIDNPQWVANVWSTHLNNQEFIQEKINIYPNPVTENYITVESDYEITELSIFTINGTLVKTFKKPIVNDNKINFDAFNRGIYFLKIAFEEEVIFKKIILQ